LSQVRTIWRDDIGHRVQTKYGAASDGVLLSAVVGVPEPYFTNQPLDYTLLCDTQWLTTSDDCWNPFGASKLSIVTEGTEPYSAYSLRHRYPAGDYQVTVGGGNVTTMELSTKMQEVYVGVILKKSANWTDHPTGYDSPKLCFILDSDFSGGGDPLYFRVGSDNKPDCSIQNNEYPATSELPNRLINQSLATVTMPDDTWTHIEVVAVMNSPQTTDVHGDGTSDGELYMWVNGTLVISVTDCWFSDVSSPKWDIINVNPLWGGTGEASIPTEMYLYNNHTRVAYKT